MKDDLVFLQHIFDSIKDIENYTDGGEEVVVAGARGRVTCFRLI